MSYQIRINPIASEDIKNIKEYIAEDNLDAAIKVVKDIVEKIESLSEFPEMGKMLMYKINLNSKYRYAVSGSYLIFYLFENNIVSVQRVLHGSRDYMYIFSQDILN